ncbi:MAG: activator of (R)-2-hydroxyglutaryl-CoA dehydratase [Acidobacteria bacterium]|nr:activator of (R)-2-hydroxyglutaryl-CoA dehydratase [Acidobacteriota bacterium]
MVEVKERQIVRASRAVCVSPNSNPPHLIEEEIRRRLEAERARLEQEEGVHRRIASHFRRPAERPFTAPERGKVTILFGGLTWKHEKLIKAVFEGCGYHCQNLPTPNGAAYQIGREYGNNGQCNPTYFTTGNLIQCLQQLEAGGLSRQEIIDRYVFFTAGSCGPCRFGMYESEYRLTLRNAGFDGFRVLLFQSDAGVKAASGEPGLKFTVDFGMGMFHALNLGDVMHDLIYQIRPYEINQGETDRLFAEAMEDLFLTLRDRDPFEILQRTPSWLCRCLARKPALKNTLNTLGKIYEHLYGKAYVEALRECRDHLSRIEVDRTRVKPIVKITGEFWAQTTEGDGNFNMFAFLEREGAQVLVEPIATWVMYLLYQAKAGALNRKGLDAPYCKPRGWDLRKRLANELHFRKKWFLFSLGERIWARQYHRVAEKLGHLTHRLPPQRELAGLAHPFYHQLARGGEGHLEVGKNIYYTVHHLCHMVLALKPFGCMPSSQSDGVQSAVINHFKEMIFLPIETSGEGELNAHSRVQMALGEAKLKAKIEFQKALDSTGKRFEEIQAYVADHPPLRRAFYRVPHRPGVAGVAANFILHVSDLMDGKADLLAVSDDFRAPSAGFA